MSEENNVVLKSSGRNLLDVATELTELYYSRVRPTDVNEVKETFSKLYKAVVECKCGR